MSQSPYNKPMGKPAATGTGAAKTSGKAIASLILGIISIIPICITGIVGVVLGILALGDISKSHGRIQGKGLAITGIVFSAIGILVTPVIGILIGMLLPAVQQVRSAARMATSQNNVRQQVIAMHNYNDVYKRLPDQQRDGLSWRVHLLPFLEQNHLYEQFRLDEPWDSSHNIQLLDQMPDVYKSLNAELPAGMTVYQVPWTDVNDPSYQQVSAMFDNSGTKLTFQSFPDGISNTIAILEVNESAAVEWTKPSDWQYDPNNPMRDVGDLNPGGIVAGMADGSAQRIAPTIAPETFRGLITRNGGEMTFGF